MSREEQVEKLTAYMANFIGYTAKVLPDDVIAKLDELAEEIVELAKPKWIPCSERLPDREALCCDRIGYMLVGYVKEENGRYIAETDDDYLICAAWMPLPEPYKGE